MDNNVKSNHDIIGFYKGQLAKFNRIGIGNETEFKVVVTEKIINCTKKRIEQLRLNINTNFETEFIKGKVSK
ncbi:hypothetical protein CL621_01145 [archaeon]|nr:hypothetical protein [archaeon]|tara:strand:- start:42 stop:257 length:216 start_codon:yes stop_codon:yes gene_type:complete